MRLISAGVLLILTGCAGELEDPDRFTQPIVPDAGGAVGECPDIETEVFATQCAGSICHDADAPAGNLDLVTAGVAERLIDVASTCEGALLVDSTNPGTGFLLEKLGPSPACGGQMPLGQPALSADLVDCVRQWTEEVTQ